MSRRVRHPDTGELVYAREGEGRFKYQALDALIDDLPFPLGDENYTKFEKHVNKGVITENSNSLNLPPNTPYYSVIVFL